MSIMWKLVPLLILFIAPNARADLVHRLSTSTQLTVNGAATSATRLGSTYTVSGSNIKVDTSNSGHFGALTAGSATAAPTLDVGTYVINTAGSAFSFSLSSGFAGFDTPETFAKFNRALRATAQSH